MGAGKTITSEQMGVIWKLHERQTPKDLISEVTSLSLQSVVRVIEIMTAAKNGEDLEKSYNGSYKAIKEYALSVFGRQEEKPEESKAADLGNIETLLTEILAELKTNNQLLEQLQVMWK